MMGQNRRKVPLQLLFYGYSNSSFSEALRLISSIKIWMVNMTWVAQPLVIPLIIHVLQNLINENQWLSKNMTELNNIEDWRTLYSNIISDVPVG